MNLCREIEKYLENHSSINILIAGVSCSGKTTLADEICDYFFEKCSVAIVHQDDYFKDLIDIPRWNGWRVMDVPDAFHINEFREDVKRLLENRYLYMPTYDIASNRRISKTELVPKGKINIFEGLHTIRILDGLENCVKIFVDTDLETCLDRRIARDTTKFGVSREKIETYWNSCILPMSIRYVLPQKDEATIIL